MWAAFVRAAAVLGGGGLQRLLEIGEDVVDMFEADAEADQVGGDASGDLGGGWELAMGGTGAVDGQ